jgi:hypothetical protein
MGMGLTEDRASRIHIISIVGLKAYVFLSFNECIYNPTATAILITTLTKRRRLLEAPSTRHNSAFGILHSFLLEPSLERVCVGRFQMVI